MPTLGPGGNKLKAASLSEVRSSILSRGKGPGSLPQEGKGPASPQKVSPQSPQEVRSNILLRRRLVHNQYLEHGDNLDSEDQLRAEGDALISKGPATESHS
ncbi:hypothetical protein Tco_1386645 [Tanacetum coccineum]